MKKAIIAIAAVVALASCHANYEKTPSGLVYKIFPGKGGLKLADAKFVKLDIAYILKRSGKDSVLNSTFGKFPQYSPIDTSAKATYSYMEILHYCSVGDSVEFTLSADTLRKNNLNLPLDIFPKGDLIKGKMKILNAFKTREDIMADVAKEQDLQKAKEAKDIENYIANKHWNAQKTKNGAYVVVDQPGQGAKADTGKVATVKYRGFFMTDEKNIFDTNMDSSKGHASDGYPVTVGAHGVIPGWEEALPYFAKGGKGKVIVPSALGYGPQPYNGIPGGSILVFDLEIVDVKDAPPAGAPQQRQIQIRPGQH